MSELYMVGVDLAKRSFQLHGADKNGAVVFCKKLTRPQFEKALAELPSCIIVYEACATAHFWGRTAQSLGHQVRLIAPAHVKPYVKRHKSDLIDAEAIVEAALRPSMRFVEVKTETQQSQAVIFRTRELLVRQRTQLINAARAHLAEFGIAVAAGASALLRLSDGLDKGLASIHSEAAAMIRLLLRQINEIRSEVVKLDTAMKHAARSCEETKRLQTMPGVGPISAMAIQAYCPPAAQFSRGRDFAAWLGLTPRQHSTGDKARLGRVTKMGQKDVRRLLITGAMSVITAFEKRNRVGDPWLQKMLERRPRIVVAVALANRMARRLWAMRAKQETYDIRGEV